MKYTETPVTSRVRGLRRLALMMLCGLKGHEMLRSFEPGRVFLRCVSCPHETAGWRLRETVGPAPRARRRSALMPENAR